MVPAEAVRVESPPVERHTLEVVAFVMTNCPSYKVQSTNRVCVCWGSLIDHSPRLYRSYYIFKVVCLYFGKIIEGVRLVELFVAQHPHQFGE
jgi:hypothetical protein